MAVKNSRTREVAEVRIDYDRCTGCGGSGALRGALRAADGATQRAAEYRRAVRRTFAHVDFV